MKTREEIFDVYLDFYSSDIKVKKMLKSKGKFRKND